MFSVYLGPNGEGPHKLRSEELGSESAQSPPWLLLPVELAGRRTASLRHCTCARQGAKPRSLRPRALRRNQERRARQLRRRSCKGPMWRPDCVPEQADGRVAQELEEGGEERLLLVSGRVGARLLL